MNIFLLPVLLMHFVLINLRCKYAAFDPFGHMQNQTVLRFNNSSGRVLSTENTGVTRSSATGGYLGVA